MQWSGPAVRLDYFQNDREIRNRTFFFHEELGPGPP